MPTPGDWHVDAFEIRNFRCFEELRIDFDPSLTMLVGVNGAGKTAILDALAVMLSTVTRQFGGPTRGFTLNDARVQPSGLGSEASIPTMEPQFPVSGELECILGGTGFWWQRERSSRQGRTSWSWRTAPGGEHLSEVWESASQESTSTLLPVIALYGVERLIGVRKASGTISRSRSGAYEAALDGKSDLARLSTYIDALHNAVYIAERRGEDAFAAANQLKAIELACDVVLEGTGWHLPRWDPLVNEMTLTHDDLGTLPLSYMSSGIRITAGLVIDLVSRAARANPTHGAESLLNAVPGIVLIDEVDLHLHPIWQQLIIGNLRRILPRVQFIVTTHSPQVLSTVEAKCIRVLDGNHVRKVDFSEGLRSDMILQRIMGTSPEPKAPVNADLDRYLDMVDNGQGKTVEAVELRRALDDRLGGIVNVPKLADADASLAFEDLIEFDDPDDTTSPSPTALDTTED